MPGVMAVSGGSPERKRFAKNGTTGCDKVDVHREIGLPGLKLGRQGRRPYHESGSTGLRAGGQMPVERLRD